MDEEELKKELTFEIDGSNGKHYSVKSSELNDFMAEAKETGVELSVTKPDKKEREEPEKWWSWKNLGEGVKGLWDDPTGEHGALAYMGLNLASGLGTAAGKVVGGMIKGVGDVGYGLARGVARGVETLVGAKEHTVSGILEDAHDTFSDWFTFPDWFEKRGMYDGIEGAHETMGAINNFAEMVFAMKGMGLAARGAGAIAKAGMVGKGANGLAAAKAATQAARIGQATMAAGMGGKTYAEMAADPDGPGGWRQEAAAAAAGGLEALTFGLMAPFKKMKMALPKPFEAMTRMEIAKRFAGECLKSGAMMALVEAEKKGAEALATVGTDKRWHPETLEQALKSVGTQYLVGMGFHAVGAVGKAGEYLKWRGGEKGKDVALSFQVEQNRKIYAPRLNEQAELALRAREVGAQWLESGMEGTENVKRVLPSGAVEFNDGSVWQMGRDGRATITVSDGTILDARTGAVEGMRANREAAAPEETGSVSGDSIARKRAENAGLFLDLLEQGKLPTVAQPLEGLEITETSYKKGTVLDGEWDQAKAPPVIVWVGNDGTRVLITGRSRAAAAAAAGVKEIKAVEVREDQGWSRQQAESLDAVENMREGRGTREEIARGVEALGIRSEEDCDRYGIVPERPVVDAITVLNEGSEALKSAASEGTVGRAWAAECAEKLGKKSLGEASERAQATALDMIAGKLPPEEAGAAMDAIAELAARKPDYTDREAADAIRAARERAVGRVAVDADSEMVEMPDGTIKSVAEAKAEGAAEAQEAAAEGKTVDESGWLPKAPAAPGADKAAEPTVKADGSVGCVRFEGAKATRTRSEDGREIVLIEGMTGEEMMRPENRDAAVQFVTRLKEMAGDVDLVFADVSAADAAEALLMAARVKARAEARSNVGEAGLSPQKQLVDAGQRLVDGLFGEKSGIRVRTGTPEEAEAALRAADGEGSLSKGRSPREDPLESNIRERLKFGENYDPEDSHHLAYSWKEIALYHDMGNGEYAILERLPNTKRGYERLREKIGRTYAGRVRDDIDRVVGLARDLARSHRLRLHDAGRGQEGDVRDAGVASRHEGDRAGEVDRQGQGAGERRLLKNDQGEVQGYYHRGKGEVVLFEGADAGTLAHEIGWHAVWHWAERNSPDLLLKMKRYAARAPLKLKALIKEVYGDFKGDALMDEIGAGRFERAMGERFQKLLAKSPEVRGWWRKVLHALARAWKGMARTVGGNRIDLKKIEKMDPEEAIEALTAQMLEGRRLGEGRGNAEGDIRPSIGGIYTGTAADYANRSRQGGKDDGPSLKKIGTGEGSQVYGWGLYGSNVRGVAEGYAKGGMGTGTIRIDGKKYEAGDDKQVESRIAKRMGWEATRGHMPTRDGTLARAEAELADRKQQLKSDYLDKGQDAPHIRKWISDLEEEVALLKDKGKNIEWVSTGKIYEQTFFTDRAPGDESHLLKWYEPVSEENIKRVLDQYAKEHDGADLRADTPSGTITFEDFGDRKMFAEALKENAGALKEDGASLYRYVSGVLGSEQAASEFLARAGIDGVKYPVDSYGGKGVKDGDVAGWNYVSFRDDNIRVDHKWTDGQLRFSRALIGGKETAVAEGYPLSIREARDPEKVLGVLSPLVGKSAAQIGEMKLTRINAKSIEHMINSEHARADIKRSGKSAKKLWRGTVAGMSVTDDIVATSTLGTKEQPKHLNAEWKKGATFYRAKTRFAVETEEGRYEIYPCELIVAEKKGERIVYDITEIGAPTLSAAASQKGSTVGSQLKDGATAHGGVGATPQSISQQGGGAQGEIRPQIKKRRDEVYDDVLRAVRAGGQRVAAGRSERTDAGWDAGANLYLEREGQVEKAPDGSMTLAYSEALRLYRALAANAHMPKILEKMPWLAGRGRDGRLRLNAAAFGIVDKSDLEAVKAGLKKDGMFLNEDPSWRLHNSYEEVKAMKELSEQALAEEMEGLAEARIKGKTSGGGRTAVNILAKEIGRIACELPTTAGAPQCLKDLRKLGMGISKELGDPKGELGKEAQEAARWWREQDPVRKDPTATKSEGVAASELWAEMFGMFLADPVGLEAHAPKVYAKMVEAIAGNEKLAEAWNGLRRTRDAEGPHERVMRDIERQWDVNEQQAYKELLAELDKPIGKWGKRTRARLLLELHSAEGPAVMWVTDAVRERLAELKRLKKAGKIGEEEYDLLAGGAKRELEKMRVALLHKQRGGGTGRLYALDFASGVMEDVARDGVDMGDLRRYMYAKSVRDGLHQKGKAAALGMDPREAQKILEELEGRLGADGWAKLETAAKRFQATREQHLLENEFVLEAFGRDLVNYWKMNASYVRSERTWTAEEVAAYEAARSDWMARHPGESTVIAEIEALMDMHVAKGSGTAGSSFLKPLAGSLKAVKDPIAATLENDLRIIEFAQRNHWACQLAESAKTLGMEGFAVMEDRGGGGKLRGSNRYGSVTFLKDGKRMTLVMPKVVAEGFEHDSRGVSKLVKLNRWASAILTQYSPRFALRNIWRNRASNANNIAWMGEGRLVTGMGMVGMRPVARLATFLLERAASHLPDRFARNALMNVLYGSKTNLYWEAEATRLAKMMQDPQLLRRRAEEANSLMLQGKSAEAQRLWDDIQKCQEFMKLPIFAGVRKQIMGESGKADLDELMRSLNLETNFDGTKLKGLKRAKRWMQRRAETVKRFNDFEEARVKLIALLAAQHEAELAQARGEAAPRSRDEITYQVATMSGSPRYENRGRAMNYIEFACGPFMNVGMKGAYRTLEAMRYDPKAWWTKAASRIAGRLATSVLWMGGGYAVLAKMLGEEAGDDEEKQKNAGWLMRFGRRMAHGLANCSDYRLRNYDIVPVGLYGKWSTLAISMPRGDEDRLLMPAVDLLAHGLLGSERAQEAGFSLPTDLNYTGSQAVQNTVLNSGLVPDLTRRGLLMSLFQDAIGPLVGWNPYNTFTQRTVYSEADFESRFADPGNMASKVGKQLWNDVGGQVVMPATTWDEDEGAYDDQGQWALSGAEEGEAGCMPIGGKTIFQALHSIPFLSAAASGLITFQNGGNERIARRLEKYRRDDSAPLRAAAQRVADEVIEAVRANGEDFDYSEMLAARVSELGLPEEDAEIIEGLAFKKVQGIAAKIGSEFDPIGKTLRKMSRDEKMYRRAKRQVEAEGWDGDFD